MPPKNCGVRKANWLYFTIFSIDRVDFPTFWAVFLSLKIVFTPRFVAKNNSLDHGQDQQYKNITRGPVIIYGGGEGNFFIPKFLKLKDPP